MAKRRCDRKLERRWRRLLRQQAKSRLSVREFCRREKLSEPSFYAWRRTIAERDGHVKPKHRPTLSPKRKPNGQPPFLPLVLDTSEASNATDLILELCGERRLRLPATVEPDRLAAIVHALEAEPQR